MSVFKRILKSLHSVSYVCNTIQKRHIGLDNYNEIITNFKIDYFRERETNQKGRSEKATEALHKLGALGVLGHGKPEIYKPLVTPINLTELACLDLFVFGGDIDTPASRDGILEIYTKYSSEVQQKLLNLGLSSNLVFFPPNLAHSFKYGSSMTDGAWLNVYRDSDWIDIAETCSISKESCYLSEQNTMYAIVRKLSNNEIHRNGSHEPANIYTYNCFYNFNIWSAFHAIICRTESRDGFTIKSDNQQCSMSLPDRNENIAIGHNVGLCAQRNNFSNPPEMLKSVLNLRYIKQQPE